MILLLITCFIVFLFTLYALANDDLVILRKNVSMEHLFNMSFVTGAIALLGARIVYVAFNFSPNYLNPLVFLIFPYFPGLSLSAAVISAGIFLFLFYIKRRILVERIFDYISISFFVALTFGSTLTFLIQFFSRKPIGVVDGLIVVLFIAILCSFIFFLIPLQRKGEFKDGTLGFMVLLGFSAVSLTAYITRASAKSFLFIGYEGVLLLCIFIFSLIFLLRQEKLLPRLPFLTKSHKKRF